MEFLKKHWRETAGLLLSVSVGWMLSIEMGLPGWSGAFCCAVGYAIFITSVKLRPKLGYATSWAAAGSLTGAVFFLSGLLVSGDRVANARTMGAAGVLVVISVAAIAVPPRLMRQAFLAGKKILRNRVSKPGAKDLKKNATKSKAASSKGQASNKGQRVGRKVKKGRT